LFTTVISIRWMVQLRIRKQRKNNQVLLNCLNHVNQ
jgi:hypothetical protein